MIFIGIPHTGTIRTELAQWVGKQSSTIFYSYARPIDHNRNIIVDEFLKTDCTHLLMVDSDVVPPDNVVDMVHNDVPVCCAHVSTSINGETIPVGMTKVEGGYAHNFEHSAPALHKVDATGTGCILIKREVFDKIDKPYFAFKYDEDGFLSNGEDFDFTERVGDVYFDGRYRCAHYTTVAI